MIVNGREVRFAYNMRAAKMIVDIAPERDLSRLGESLNGTWGNVIENQARFIIAMSTAYCMSSDHRAEEARPITMDELMDLDQDTFLALVTEAMQAMQAGGETHVRTKPAPRKKVGTQPENQS